MENPAGALFVPAAGARERGDDGGTGTVVQLLEAPEGVSTKRKRVAPVTLQDYVT